MRIDGYESPIDLVASVTIGEDTIHVDFTGTSGMSSYAINCPLCYTEAYTTFGINCVIAPQRSRTMPARLDAVKVTAPPGTIVSATYPAAVYARSSIGHMMPDVVYGCTRSGDSGTRAGRGDVQSVEPQDGRRPWPDRGWREGRHTVHGHEFPFRWRRRAAAAGRAVGNAVSHPACGTFRWRRPKPSRPW